MKSSLMLVAVILTNILTVSALDTYYVAEGGDDSRTGIGHWSNAVATISNGVRLAALAGDGNVVLISNGFYQLTTQVSLTASVSVRGFGNRESVIVDGGDSTRCFDLNHANACVCNLTITNGRAGDGGGVYITSGAVSNCLITGNTATNSNTTSAGGGGVYLGTSGQLYDSWVIGNIVTNQSGYIRGGGIFISGASALASNCLIAGNSSYGATAQYSGGGGVGIYMFGRVERCVISNNYSSSHGGGMHFATRFGIQIAACDIVDNITPGYGGGIFLRQQVAGGTTVITNCTISNNTATGVTSIGGGVYANGDVEWTVKNSRIADNSCGNDGGGLFITRGAIVDTCLVHGNVADTVATNTGGGGIKMHDGSVVFNTIIENNYTEKTSATWGGAGVVIHGGILSNCVIQGNSGAASRGNGALFYGPGQMVNCLVTGNISASSLGAGGIMFRTGLTGCVVKSCTVVSNVNGGIGSSDLNASNMVLNTVIAGNSLYDAMATGAGTNSFWYCCMTNELATGHNNITNQPLFMNATGGDYRLSVNSPCVNAGATEEWMAGALDLDGRPRLDRFTRRVDMGCYECMPAGVMFSIR